MAKPYIHATSSARKWGGVAEDYVAVHDLMDSSKSVIADNRHRTLTHHSWFLFVAERILGHNVISSSGRKVSVRDLGEQHLLEDFSGRYQPTAEDYLRELPHEEWMQIEDSAASHAEHSAQVFGGCAQDYLAVHELINSAEGALGDGRWRALTHHAWFCKLLERVFSESLQTDAGPVRVFDVGVEHVRRDFGRLLTAQEWLEPMQYREWMNNAQREAPPSSRSVLASREKKSKGESRTVIRFDLD